MDAMVHILKGIGLVMYQSGINIVEDQLVYNGNEDILWVIPMLRATDTLCVACEDVLAHFEVSHNNLLN